MIPHPPYAENLFKPVYPSMDVGTAAKMPLVSCVLNVSTILSTKITIIECPPLMETAFVIVAILKLLPNFICVKPMKKPLRTK